MRQPGRSRRRKLLRWLSVAAAVIVTAGSLTAYAAYRNVVDGIHRVDVSGLLGRRPPQLTSAMNILIIGSDSRAGTHGRYGNPSVITGARSDTMMVAHILPDHRGAVVVSFPRDSMVPILSCKPDGIGDPGQKAQPGLEMLNATFAYGGAPCLWKTLESLTGIYINHFVQIDFNGFKQVINDLGGVNVCLPEAINDPASGLHLSAGLHHVNGSQALAFVRERHIGEGSDLQRIERQQYFMASVLQEIKSKNLLSDLPQLYKIAVDASRSLTTDSGFSISSMLSVAESLKGVSTKAVQFVQVPVVEDPSNPNRVLWEQPQADQLFNAIAHDRSVSGDGSAGSQGGTGGSSSPVGAAPVRVTVYNATATTGLAARVAGQLRQRHVEVIGTGNSPAPSTATLIQYSSAAGKTAADALRKLVPNAHVEQVAGVAGGTVDLVLGSDFTGLAASSGSSTNGGSSPHGSGASSNGSRNLTKTYGGITGNTNICHDAGAFSGPDVPSDFAP